MNTLVLHTKLNTFNQDKITIEKELDRLTFARFDYRNSLQKILALNKIDCISASAIENHYPTLVLNLELEPKIKLLLSKLGYTKHHSSSIFHKNGKYRTNILVDVKAKQLKIVCFGSHLESDIDARIIDLETATLSGFLSNKKQANGYKSAESRINLAKHLLNVGYEPICDSLYFKNGIYVTLHRTFISVRNKPALH